MKVKIAYTVNLDEVPQKIQELIKSSEELLFSKKAKDNFKQLADAFETNSVSAGLESLEAIRSNLIEADFKLEDCVRLLVDYHQAISKINFDKYNGKEESTQNEGEE